MVDTASTRVEHSVVFEGSVAAAWTALLAPEPWVGLTDARFAPAADGGIDGRLKLRFGTVNPTFRGTASVSERNGRAHRIVVELRGTDVRGSGDLTATVTAAARRVADATVVRVAADVTFTGRPAGLSEAKRRGAVTRVVEQFLQGLTDSRSGGEVVADQPTENPSDTGGTPPGSEAAVPRKRPRPSPAGQPAASAASAGEAVSSQPSAPDLPPDDSVEQPVTEPTIETTSGQGGGDEPEPWVGAQPTDATPAFGTPGGIPVPELGDEPSVNGHSPAAVTPLHADEKFPLATSTRQAMARRVAPVAVGLVFVLAAARRRRGRNA